MERRTPEKSSPSEHQLRASRRGAEAQQLQALTRLPEFGVTAPLRLCVRLPLPFSLSPPDSGG